MSQLADALASLDEDEVAKLVRERIDAGIDAMSVINECRSGMDIVGERYKSGEYFLSELVVSGEIFKECMKVLEPLLKAGGQQETLARMVLGTVKGDIHNIGKDIVAVLLKGAGFEVHDLGVDVAPQAFVEKLVETEAPILGLSGLLTPSFESMKETVEAVEAAGLRDRVRVIVGGGVVTELVRKHVGADAFSSDGLRGVEMCKEFARAVK